MEIRTIGITGAGIMGNGVAQAIAQYGYRVVLIDISDEILENSRKEIIRNTRLQAFFNKEMGLVSADTILGRITFTTDYDLLKECDYIIENVTESRDTKLDVYKKISRICVPGCIFAANTSCISITEIAKATNRPDEVIGIHFMNPVPIKKTVEVIRGYHTSDETVKVTEAFMNNIGKSCVIVNDLPGFVSNRISHLFMNEAAFVVQDGVADPKQVDKIFRECYGHKMGPLETADLIGLDTVVNSLDVLVGSYNDSKFRCCPLLRKMVDAGLYGRKSGKGFYEY